MSDQYERVRERLDQALRDWAKALSMLLLHAQKENAIPKDLDPEMLAENLISSFQGALLRSKVKKSSEPLKNFMYLYFDRFLAQKEKVT